MVAPEDSHTLLRTERTVRITTAAPEDTHTSYDGGHSTGNRSRSNNLLVIVIQILHSVHYAVYESGNSDIGDSVFYSAARLSS